MLAYVATPEYLHQQIVIAQQAFDLMAGMTVFPSAASPSAFAEEHTIHGSIRYFGTFEGSLSIECAPSVAFTFTERAMRIGHPRVLTDDVRDAIGELINTIAGTLKSAMPLGTKVDTPQVSARTALREIDQALSCLLFDSEFGPFRLILLDTPGS